ncbi:MAG: hypothetical protein K2H85_02165 [Allobaculum sp.]|nr:hypothetical protein [Allobaculum sp.]
MTNNGSFGWDDEIILDEPEFVVLMPGKYVGSIYKVERKRESKGKFNGHLYAEISLAIEDDQGQTAHIKDKLYLIDNMKFKIKNFLMVTGAGKKGEPVRVNLISQTVGRKVLVTLGCQIKNRSTDKYELLEAKEAQRLLDSGENVYNVVRKYEQYKSTENNESMDEFGFTEA